MLHLHRIFTSLALVLTTSAVMACSCIYIPTFCETISFGVTGTEYSYHIALVETDKKFNDGMRIKVLDVLYGDLASDHTYMIRKGNGADCQVNTDGLDEKKQYLMALGGPSESSEFLYLFECGVTYLPVTNGIVNGPVADGVNSAGLNELKAIMGCEGLEHDQSVYAIYPNPASNIIKIKSSVIDPSGIKLTIHAINGSLIRSEDIDFAADTLKQVDVSGLSSGVYLFTIEYTGRKTTQKIVLLGPEG